MKRIIINPPKISRLGSTIVSDGPYVRSNTASPAKKRMRDLGDSTQTIPISLPRGSTSLPPTALLGESIPLPEESSPLPEESPDLNAKNLGRTSTTTNAEAPPSVRKKSKAHAPLDSASYYQTPTLVRPLQKRTSPPRFADDPQSFDLEEVSGPKTRTKFNCGLNFEDLSEDELA